ncbi:hypothetical protein M0804_010718 [Polistes exclamans]|nr:hypothetical protein M0804_010718 [Polistes exclamans]
METEYVVKVNTNAAALHPAGAVARSPVRFGSVLQPCRKEEFSRKRVDDLKSNCRSSDGTISRELSSLYVGGNGGGGGGGGGVG